MHRKSAQIGIVLGAAVLLCAVPLASAHAQSLFGIPSLSDIVQQFVAWMMNLAISAMSLLVTIAGMLLNFSINLTLNIKSFVDSTPAVYTTWRTIRDISGMFLIFVLLYAAFQLILDYKRPNFNQLITNVVVAGILINFSFFFAGLGIDVSNVVSVQLYNAIAPANSLNAGAAESDVLNGTWRSSLDGGLSDIFMNHLKVQAIYQTQFSQTNNAGSAAQAAIAGGANALSATVASAPVKIFLMGVIAVIIEFTAAMSFGAAALAFIFRFVVLILLLAFSPIMMLGFLAPEIKKYTSKWFDHYKAMLIFMPVYLLLMYVAMSVLTTSPLFGNTSTGAVTAAAGAPGGITSIIENAFAQTAGTTGNGAWYSGLLSIGVNAAIVIFLLNMPLAAAASIAGGVIGMLKTADKNWSANAIWSKFGSQAGSRTLGRAAYAVANSERVAKIAGASPIAGSLITGGLQKVSKAGFGGGKKGSYEERLKAKAKSQDALHKQIGTLDRSKFAQTPEGEAAYQKAFAARAQAQKNYRENLPWGASGKLLGVNVPGLRQMSGTIGFMVDNRANRQTAMSLTDAANLDENKKKQADLQDKMNGVLKNRISGVKEEMKRYPTDDKGNPDFGYMDDNMKENYGKLKAQIDMYQDAIDNGYKGMKNKEALLNDEERKELERLQSEKSVIDSAVKRASGKKKQADTAALAKALADANPSEDGEKKGEKKEGEEKKEG